MPVWEIIAIGRVQRVGFRYWVSSCAFRNGIKGFVKNLDNGSVLIIASGENHDFLRFCEHIRSGNTISRVDDLCITLMENSKDYDDFTIK